MNPILHHAKWQARLRVANRLAEALVASERKQIPVLRLQQNRKAKWPSRTIAREAARHLSANKYLLRAA